ncbi:MAG: diguanylate cyclase [Deltaproteobacteria bacterium]|nr:diguanylate cyclase [Deltaproteobacteria bacterium]
MPDERIFLLHSDNSERSKLSHFLESTGLTVSKFARLKELSDELKLKIPSLVILRADTKEYNIPQVVREIKSSPDYIPVLLICPAAESEAEKIFSSSGADSFITLPIRRTAFISQVNLMLDIRRLKSEVTSLRDEVNKLKIFLTKAQGMEPITNFYNFEFFKKILSIELKRAQRYNFPLSIMVCFIDNYGEICEKLKESEKNSLILNISMLIRQNIRDLDIPVYYKEGHIMIVMPHTSIEGAVTLAERIRTKVIGYKPESEAIKRITLSIGVADRGRSENISFFDMCKGALLSLEKAIKDGGNRVAIPDLT